MGSDEKKSHNKAVNKYARKNYDRVPILVPKGERERWTDAARRLGFIHPVTGQVSVSRFVRSCVEDRIGKPQIDNTQPDCSEARNDIE